MTREQVRQILDLKAQAWDALPDTGPGNPADLARFVAICDVCRILGLNG